MRRYATVAIGLAVFLMTSSIVSAKEMTVDDTQKRIQSICLDESQIPIVSKEEKKHKFIEEYADPDQVPAVDSTQKTVTEEKTVYVVEAKSLIVREYPDFNYIQVDHVSKGDVLEGIVIEKCGYMWLQLSDNRYVCIMSHGVEHISEETISEEIYQYSYSGVAIENVSLDEPVTLECNSSSDILQYEKSEPDGIEEETEVIVEVPEEAEIVSEIEEIEEKSSKTQEISDFSGKEAVDDDFGDENEEMVVSESGNLDTEEFMEETVEEEIPPEEFRIYEEMISDPASENRFTDEEVYLAAQLVYNEAIGEGQAGQIGVCEVLLGRVNSDRFPDTIEGVIYQSGQFENNQNIKYRRPNAELVALVDSVLNGNVRIFDNPDVLFFRNANGNTNDWGKYPHYATINHHEYYTIK